MNDFKELYYSMVEEGWKLDMPVCISMFETEERDEITELTMVHNIAGYILLMEDGVIDMRTRHTESGKTGLNVKSGLDFEIISRSKSCIDIELTGAKKMLRFEQSSQAYREYVFNRIVARDATFYPNNTTHH